MFRFIKILFGVYLMLFTEFLSSQEINLDNKKTDTTRQQQKKRNKEIKEKTRNADDYFVENFIRNEDFIYNPNIKTIQFNKLGWALSAPLLELGSSEKLLLSFDDLSSELQSYKFTIYHCNSDWTTSDLQWFEFAEGFMEDAINKYSYSFNTIQKYIHYELSFPTENIRPIKSGNYIIKVYVDGEAEKPIFTRRFMIFENLINVDGVVKQATNIEDQRYKQEVDFNITYQNYSINNPYNNLKIVITQNDRWDNAITNLKPRFVKGNELVYDYEDGNIFNGGNEFRNFDLKSIKNYSFRIKKIFFDTSGYHVFLLGDERRTFKVYYSYTDINGKRLIKTEDYQDSQTEAEYAFVHFVLPYQAPIVHGNLYVFGEITDWKFTKEAQLKYNYEHQVYETSIYLKQGFYDYCYVLLENGKNTADDTFIEGNHWDTENNYCIYVYYREQGKNFDKLIAVKRLNSLRK